jgi:outer membrane murein-binding lipoprotein Lpp
MAVSVWQDEDLIIINSDSDDDIFNFWEKSNTEVKKEVIEDTSSEGMIDFLSDEGWVSSTIEATSSISENKVDDEISFTTDLLEVKEETTSLGIETPSVDNKKEDEEVSHFDFSFDLDDTSEEKSGSLDLVWNTSKSEEIALVDNSSKEDSFFDEVSDTDVVSSDESQDIWDINSILDQTIEKLNSRKWIISTQKDDKSSKVESLLAQIKSLEETVASYREEIESLDVEFKKIDKNISAIEKMKSDSWETNIERPRQHNLNNIKKTK